MHARHGVVVWLRDEVDVMAALVGEMSYYVAVLSWKVLMYE
jgi:hypothetical protein